MQHFVTTCGNKFFYDSKELILRGIGLGTWLNIEGHLLGLPGTDDSIREPFKKVFGEKVANDFFDLLITSMVSEKDFEYLRSINVNCLRLAVNYSHFFDDEYCTRFNEKGFEELERVVDLCEKYQIFAVIDMHTAPGGQNRDPHSGCSTGVSLFWKYEALQDSLINLWQELARRYCKRTIIAGYDILNEPCFVPDYAVFNRFVNKTIHAIRTIDENHIIFIEGDDWAKNFAMFELESTEKIAFTFHLYPQNVKKDYGDSEWSRASLKIQLDKIFSSMSRYELPIWCGETGVTFYDHNELNSSKANYIQSGEHEKMLQDMLAELEERQISWSMWTYKDGRYMGLKRPKPDSAWNSLSQKVGDSWGRHNSDNQATQVVDFLKDNFGDMSANLAEETRYKIDYLLEGIALEYALSRNLELLKIEDLSALAESFEIDNCETGTFLEDAMIKYFCKN